MSHTTKRKGDLHSIIFKGRQMNSLDIITLELILDELIEDEQEQSNCMFQLSLMLARIALTPGLEDFKERVAHILIRLIAAKSKKIEMADLTIRSVESEKPAQGAQLQRFAAANLNSRR